MYRSQDVVIDKEKVQVVVHLGNETLNGIIHVGGQERVFDVLNKGDLFVPLEVDGNLKFINKSAITILEADDAARMDMQTERRSVRSAMM